MNKPTDIQQLKRQVAQLQNRVDELQSHAPKPVTASRRDILTFSGATAAALLAGTGVASATHDGADDPHSMAFWIGDGDPPPTSDPVFDNLSDYHIVYLDRPNGVFHTIESPETSWTIQSIGSSAQPVPAVTADDLKYDTELHQDVTSSRSSGTWETNNSDYPLEVIVQVNSDGTADGRSAVEGDHNTSETDNTVAFDSGQASTAVIVGSSITFTVSPGHSYKVTANQGSIFRWHEAKLGSPGN